MSDKQKPKYYEKIGKFTNFEVTPERFQSAQTRSAKQLFKHFRNAFLFAVCVEYAILKSRIYENIIRSSTIRRLDSKKKEDENLRERKVIKQDNVQK